MQARHSTDLTSVERILSGVSSLNADLTEMGQNEARSLNSMLYGGKWFSKMTADRPTRAIISPLSRCLQTATLVASGLPLTGMEVEENIRETLGEDTCDARRSRMFCSFGVGFPPSIPS